MKTEDKRIAKNTLFMYLRMGITMVISLYTSRLVLQNLGVSDFGIYNVIGGLVILFSFVINALGASTLRFVSSALAQKNEKEITETFATIVTLYLIFSLVVVFLSETIGLSYVHNYLRFPAERMDIVQYVFQFSMLNTVFIILSSPFSSFLVSMEKMNVYAYLSIIDVIGKLAIVALLTVIPFDKLFIYAAFQATLAGSILLFYLYYFKRNKFVSTFLVRLKWQKTKEILVYSSWSLYGSIAGVASTQGINLMLNYFFGNIINAAFGISSQVRGAITNFVSGFQVALNPQITKSYAIHDMERHGELIGNSMKYSFILISMIGFPILFNIKEILDLWLVEYPTQTVVFLKWSIISFIVETISNPLSVSIAATGRIGRYTIVISTINILTLPISYMAIMMYDEPVVPFIVIFTMTILKMYSNMYFCRKLSDVPVYSIFRDNILMIVKILSFSLPICYLMNYMVIGSVWYLTICRVLIDFLLFISVVYGFGLRTIERHWVNNKIISIINNDKK